MEEKIISSNCPITRVLIIDPTPLIRYALRHLLERTGQFDVIGDNASYAEGIECAIQEKPDIIILDLDADLASLDIIKTLREKNVDARIIILTYAKFRHNIFTRIDSPIDGYLLKDTNPQDLIQQIQFIANGNPVFNTIGEHKNNEPICRLTQRELQVLARVAQGFSNRKIADTLYISEETVKVHIRNVLNKLNIHSRLTAAVMYLDYFGKK